MAADSPTRASTGRFYVKRAVVPFEEDLHHEFKGHRCLAVEELAPFSFHDYDRKKRSKRAASRAINSFLNSGQGGTVYLGVSDDGSVIGLPMTQYQKDHVVISLKDLLEKRYRPTVASDQYQLDFIPVLPPGVHSFDEVSRSHPALSFDVELRRRPHQLRTHFPCWCDKDLRAIFHNGHICPEYLIQIHIKPFESSVEQLFPSDDTCSSDDDDDGNDDSLDTILKLQLPNVYEDEEGRSYFRLQASSLEYSLEDIRMMVSSKAKDYYQPIVRRWERQLSRLKKEVSEAGLET